ncbi:MAG: PBP1A family penicillin-binding protein [Alphaproteobacteria bacterium]|nr:PBP1A family penicillin-binding protein [Alphaproteobacteria bacterium]MBV9370696.1 PBP1A family penicillin-binding protein [Alphaproteobacteria bacterium]MBV9899891.1 PBP1A family penicillin-binding protein [Alphaproteobacteria bacterium]
MARDASPRTPLKRTLIGLLKFCLYGSVIGLIALVVAVGVAMSQLPSYGELSARTNLGQTIVVRAADGSVLVSMGPSFGNWLRSDEIPEIMKSAMISVEDRRFRYHPGVDPIGILRGIGVSFRREDKVRGVSTITQQLARNIFLSSQRNYGRKLKEAILALALERRFTKDQILELYLNRVYFGGGAYGIDAASRRFFGHSAKTLNLSEAAIIAGLVKAPSNYAPSADAEAARRRASVVIDLMVKNGGVSAAEAAAAAPANVRIIPAQKQNSVRYFTDWVLPQLDTLIDETGQAIEVWTTLDPNMQKLADQVVNANTPAGAQGALVALDRDGAVRAMVGGRDYVSSIYNRATQAARQPGSAFKLFVYLAALEAGNYRPDSMVSADPIVINGWSPRNNGHSFSGQVPLRQAFAQSINTVSVRLAQEVGFGTVADMARRLGITNQIRTHPSMALGANEVRLIDMTRAFASVQRKGVAVTPYGIKRVTTAGGEILYQQQADESRVLYAPYVAAEMTDLMQTAVMTGTGAAAQIGRPVAGKTGTTTLNKDGWFLGFSSGLTTGVWMGRDDSKPVPGLQGGRAPARAFHDFMIRAVANRPVEPFETQVQAPTWQNEPDDDAWYGGADNGQSQSPEQAQGQFVDPDGNPVARPPATDGDAPPAARPDDRGDDEEEEAPPVDRLDQEWLDRAINRDRAPPRRDPQGSGRRPPPAQRSAPADPVERRPLPSQP